MLPQLRLVRTQYSLVENLEHYSRFAAPPQKLAADFRHFHLFASMIGEQTSSCSLEEQHSKPVLAVLEGSVVAADSPEQEPLSHSSSPAVLVAILAWVAANFVGTSQETDS